MIADRSGHSLNSAINPTTGATFSLVNDVPPVLATSNTTSLELDEASTKAVRLTGTVALTQHDLSDASWTFTTWVKRLSRTSNDFVLYLGSGDGFGGNGDELQLYFPANTDTIELRHYNASNALDLDLVSGSTATSNAWHQVALTFNRSGLKSGTATLYLDGTSVGASPVTWSLDQGDPLVIGGHNITTGTALASWLNGRLSETALFNTALSANDISVLNNLSVAQFTGLNVSGSMTLWVVTPQQSWRQNAFGNSANAGLGADGADPDHDGVPNLVEYALGSNPLSGASFALPTPGRSGNYLTLTFTRARSDVTYGVEASADLVNWITLALNPGTVGQSITVYDTVDITTAPAHRRFMRLRITN